MTTTPLDNPGCSVVLAYRHAEHDIDRCLAALTPQIGPDVELIVADDGASDLPVLPSWARRVSLPGALVPELWAAGLKAARAPVVVTTAASMMPDQYWVQTARQAPGATFAGVGGAVEPAPSQRLVDWGVYFCRYAPLMLPIKDSASLDVPADNAAYRADVLARYRPLWDDGFWEPAVHAAMRADGYRLTVMPDLIVQHAGGGTARSFARQRYYHGRAHGQRHPAGRASLAIPLALAAAPLVPPLMTLRAARRVAAKHRHLGHFVLALPLIVCFYGCWAAGELVGRLRRS